MAVMHPMQVVVEDEGLDQGGNRRIACRSVIMGVGAVVIGIVMKGHDQPAPEEQEDEGGEVLPVAITL